MPKTEEEHAEHAAKVADAVKESKNFDIADIETNMTTEDKDVFCAIMGEEFDLSGRSGTLVFCLHRILTTFEVNRKTN